MIRSNQKKDFPVIVEDVDFALNIWGKNIAALKGKTTWSKPNTVSRDYVKIPMDLLKLHKEMFLTLDIFFVNKIPFLLTLSQKICFTAVNHLVNRTVPQILAAFKEIYQFTCIADFASQWCTLTENFHHYKLWLRHYCVVP